MPHDTNPNAAVADSKTEADCKIELQRLSKVFGPLPQSVLPLLHNGMGKTELLNNHDHVVALHDINLAIPEHHIQIIMGLSGSGKSTLLRHINRLINPTAGRVLIDGRDVIDKFVGIFSPPEGIGCEPFCADEGCNAGLERREDTSVVNMELNGPAERACVFLESRPVGRPSKVNPRNPFEGEGFCVLVTGEPWGPKEFKWAGCSSPLREVCSLQEAHSRIDHSRLHGRHVRGGHDPGQSRILVPHASFPSLHGNDC